MFLKLSEFCENVPEKLLTKVYRRESFFELDKRTKLELSPLGLALEHSRLELRIGRYSVETLKKRYEAGKKLLKAATAQN
jgi:hypothetical protein